MLDVVVAVVGWVIVGWLPGYAFLDALRPQAPRLENALVGSLASLGVLMFVAQIVYLVHVPVRPWSVLPIALLACALPAAVSGRGRRRPVQRIRRRADVFLLAAVITVAIVIWCLIIGTPNAVLPGTDGAHHGLFAARIERFGTLNPATVLSGDSAWSGTPTPSYYPLALHVAAALIAGSTGIPVSVALTVAVVLAAAVILPLGMYLTIGRLCRSAHAGAIAAALSVAVPWFPYEPIVWGGAPTIVGLGQVPAAIALLTGPSHARSARREGLALGACGFGLFSEHNTELVTVGVIGVCLLVPRLRGAPRSERAGTVRGYLWGGGCMLVAVAPQLPSLVSGAADSAAQFKLTASGVATGHVTSLLPSANVALTLGFTLLPLAAVGMLSSHRKQWAPGWGWASVALTAIFVLSFSTNAVATVVTAPWFATPFRATYQLVLVLVAYAAGGTAGLITDLRKLATKHSRLRGRVFAISLGSAVLVLVVACLPNAVVIGARGYRDSSLVGPVQRSAFAWLRAHVSSSGRVLNDFNDGSAWMEVFDDVHPLFGERIDGTNVSAWGDRAYLLTHAGDLSFDLRAQAAVRRWNVRYVYVNSSHFDGNPKLLSSSEFANSSAYRPVWRRGGVQIFEIQTTD